MSSNRLNKKRPIRKVRSVPIRQLSNTSSEGKNNSELKNNKMVDTQKTLTRILFDDADKRALDLIEKRSRLSKNRVRSGDYEDFKENSTLKLLSSLEVIGSRHARRLSQGIRRQSLVSAQQPSRSSIHRKKSLGSRTGSLIGTILEIPSSEKSVDSLLTDLNPFGRFHKIVLLLLFCGAAPIVGFQNFVLEAQSIIPQWSCISPACFNLTRSYTYTHYNPDTSQILCSLGRSEWEWDSILYNAVSQWDIACSSGKLILETVFHVPGGILGALIVSRIADRMGRRLSFLVSLISCLTVGTMISSSQFFEAYVTFRLILGTSLVCIHLINYIWTLELFSNFSRPFANAAYDFARLSLVPLLALLNSYVRSWNYLHLASVITLLSGILVFFAIPESPRWLLSKGNVEGAENVLKAIARRNDEQYPLRVVLKYHPTDKTNLRKNAKCQSLTYAVLVVLWSAVHLAYMCIKHNVIHFSDDINICEAVYSVSGLPLILLAGLYMCNKLGRRCTFLVLICLALFFSILTIIPVQVKPNIPFSSVMPIVATYGIFPAVISVLSLWIVELVPTCHRICVVSLLLAVKCGLTTLTAVLLPLIDSRYGFTSVILTIIFIVISVSLVPLVSETKGLEMLEIPESEKKSTRGMTLIKKKLSTIHSQVKTTDIDIEQDNKTLDGANEWTPPSPILF
ncbi:solute carrier family 22 member 7-like isoform X2 [Bolinopsis microptera]|uniref:solute carrier family 22 member 7-like isoform X2 n=1 Tax=Bolinopsis microptera TaxID=2820187 RepID=UPI0030798847